MWGRKDRIFKIWVTTPAAVRFVGRYCGVVRGHEDPVFIGVATARWLTDYRGRNP
jgi:hypothetical protein